jgi:Ca2+-transporting ATPase
LRASVALTNSPPLAATEAEPPLLPASPSEDPSLCIPNNPFPLTPAHLSALLDPKSLSTLHQLGGLRGLETALQTNTRTGLPDSTTTTTTTSHQHQEDDDRRRVFGANRLPDRPSKSFLRLAWIALQDRVLILLSIAAAISLALGLYQTFSPHHNEAEEGRARVEWIEGVAIIVAILVVVIVGALNDWQKERQFRRLNQKKEDREVTVVRGGKAGRVSVHDVLVGDVMVLEQGDVIPVDGVLIEGHNVSCDEASATGESDVVKKTPAGVVEAAMKEGRETRKMDPFLLSGARVLDGVGTFLVTAVGEHSSLGRTMMALRDDPGMTPLQARLNVLAGRYT